MITFLYLMTFIIIALIVIKKIIKDKSISLYSFLAISIAILYLFVPAVVFLLGAYDKQSSDLIEIIYTSSNQERLEIYFLVLLSFLLISAFQKIKIGNSITNKITLSNEFKTSKLPTITHKICLSWFWVLWGIGIFCTAIIVFYIGIKGLIIYSGSSRGEGELQLESGSLFSYAVNFSRLLIASLAPGIIAYEIKKNFKMKILIIITLVLSLLLQIFNAGKTNFIIFLVPLFIYWVYKQNVIKIKHLAIIAIAMIALVPLLDNVFYYISSGESVGKYRESWNILNYVVSIAKQFAYPYSNMVMRKPITEFFGFRFFIDYLATVINVVPATLLGGFQLDTLYHLTTSYYQNVLSHQGGMPNDFIFFCYRQFGVVGIMVISLITGILVKWLDEILFETKNLLSALNINSSHLYTTFCFAGVVFVLIEPLSFLMSFPAIVFAIIITIHIKHSLRVALDKEDV
ncbi:MAG: oligosaccharide repeat unit polymerase [Clostridia bacterium]|nr:oligosaccharide repeat unit polymerase [Clostridia bacterium]